MFTKEEKRRLQNEIELQKKAKRREFLYDAFMRGELNVIRHRKKSIEHGSVER